MARKYQHDIDLAFFVVNFGYSKADYEALTRKERAFILKAWEDKKLLDMSMMYKAEFTAYYNCNRPKRKRAIKLFEQRTQKANMEIVENHIAAVIEIEAKEGKGWVDKVFAANGIKRKGDK